MSLRQLNSYGLVGNDDLDALMETEDKNFKGKMAVSLTEYDTTTIPEIAAGSVVEINGALFTADADESIGGSPEDGLVYIKVIPSGDPIVATAEFTAIAPAWDNEKQGWYSPTAGEENHRYVGGCTKSGSSYSSKFLLLILNSIGLKAYKDRISFTFLDDMEIGELVIGDLKMYAYGDLVVFTNSVGSGAVNWTETFYIKKPCYLFLKSHGGGTLIGYIYVNGGFITKSLIAVNDFAFFYPGKYRINLTDGYAASAKEFKLTCVYAEGLNELDLSKIYEEI